MNQTLLVNQVSKILDDIFILNGHFCLSAPDNNLIILDDIIFSQMNLNSIILLNANYDAIIHNIYNRDHEKYDSDFIKHLLESEKDRRKVYRANIIFLYIFTI